MAANLFVMESANLFAGSVNPDATNHLTLQELKLPGLEENFVDHAAGGSPVAIRIDTHINPLEATFNLAGWSPQVMGLIRRWAMNMQHFYAYGAIRDRKTGRLVRAYAEMWGRLGRVNPTNFRRGDLMAHEYQINGITHYDLKMGDRQIYLWDFFENTLLVDNVDVHGETNTVIGLLATETATGGREIGGTSGV